MTVVLPDYLFIFLNTEQISENRFQTFDLDSRANCVAAPEEEYCGFLC